MESRADVFSVRPDDRQRKNHYKQSLPQFLSCSKTIRGTVSKSERIQSHLPVTAPNLIRSFVPPTPSSNAFTIQQTATIEVHDCVMGDSTSLSLVVVLMGRAINGVFKWLMLLFWIAGFGLSSSMKRSGDRKLPHGFNFASEKLELNRISSQNM
jgi:hypothetical protein